MTAATRKTATVANGGDRTGTNYLIGVDTEIEALWKSSFDWLISVGGTGDVITATTDTALVAAITAWARPMGCVYVPIAANTTAPTLNRDSVGAISVKDKYGAALQGGELAIGGHYPLIFDGTNLIALTVTAGSGSQIETAPDIILQDQKTSGTAGGTFTSGSYQQRTLNILVRNNNSLGSLASNKITLPSGTYYAEWWASALQVNANQTRLWNATDSSLINFGSTEYSNSGGAYAVVKSIGCSVFTITSSKAIEIDHQCGSTVATNGFGIAATFGNIEVYAELRIWKQ